MLFRRIRDAGADALRWADSGGGIGGLARAIAALQAFLVDAGEFGMAFVVITHFSPDQTSVMAEMIQGWTTIA